MTPPKIQLTKCKSISMFGASPNNPSTRFRLAQYVPYFIKQGYEIRLFTALSPPQTIEETSNWGQLRFETQRRLIDLATVLNRLHQISYLKGNSIFFMNGFLTPIIADNFLEKIVRKRVSKMILDIDDAIFFTNHRAKQKLIKTLKICDAVAVGNEYLKNFVTQYNTNVKIIPTPVDTQELLPKHQHQHEQGKPEIIIGWMGSWTNICHLKLLIPVFQQIKQEVPNIRLVAVTNVYRLPNELSNYWELRQWSATNELTDLQSFDIGIMPLEDNTFTQGKCAFKLLQYMAVGIPVVASPVGMNREVVQDNGFLCSSVEEWVEALKCLSLNPLLRKTMGKKSRKLCETFYATEIVFNQLLSFIESSN